MQENHYYAFGMTHEGPWLINQSDKDNAYMYNGKEMNADHGLNWSDYGARYYDPCIGRFTGVDPLADHLNQVDKSPYAYAWNNPVVLNDPDGRCPHCPVGFVIGFMADVVGQVIQNKLQGKEAFQDFSFSSAIISGVSGMASGGITSVGKTLAIGTAESIAKKVVTDDGIKTDVFDQDKIVGTVTQTVSDVGLGYLGGKAKVFDDANIKVKENALDRTQRIAAGDPKSSGRAQNVVDAKNSLKNSNNANTAAGAVTGNAAQATSNVARSYLTTPTMNVGGVIVKNVQMVQDNFPKPILVDPRLGGG